MGHKRGKLARFEDGVKAMSAHEREALRRAMQAAQEDPAMLSLQQEAKPSESGPQTGVPMPPAVPWWGPGCPGKRLPAAGKRPWRRG